MKGQYGYYHRSYQIGRHLSGNIMVNGVASHYTQCQVPASASPSKNSENKELAFSAEMLVWLIGQAPLDAGGRYSAVHAQSSLMISRRRAAQSSKSQYED